MVLRLLSLHVCVLDKTFVQIDAVAGKIKTVFKLFGGLRQAFVEVGPRHYRVLPKRGFDQSICIW